MISLSIKDLMIQLWFPNEDILFIYPDNGTKSRSVECIICGRRGPGYSGTRDEIYERWKSRHWHHWQFLCTNLHTFQCACGKFFPGAQSLAEHVGQHRRYHHEGHGRMDIVGWFKK